MRNFSVDFTRIKKIHEVNNSMCHNFYFQYNGRIYNESKTKYRQFVFVLWFDIFDVMEYFEQDSVTAENIREYAGEYGAGSLPNLKSYDDTTGLQEFYEFCKQTILDFNGII